MKGLTFSECTTPKTLPAWETTLFGGWSQEYLNLAIFSNSEMFKKSTEITETVKKELSTFYNTHREIAGFKIPSVQTSKRS